MSLFSYPNYRASEGKKTNETAPTAPSPPESAPSSAQASWPGPRSDSGHRRRSRVCWGWYLVSRSRRNWIGRWRWGFRGLSGLTRRDDIFFSFLFFPLLIYVFIIYTAILERCGLRCDVMWRGMIWYNEGMIFDCGGFWFLPPMRSWPHGSTYIRHGAWYMKPTADENVMQDKNREGYEISPVTKWKKCNRRKEGNMAEGQLNWLSWEENRRGDWFTVQRERVQLDRFFMTCDWWPTICTVLSGFGLVWFWYRKHSILGMKMVVVHDHDERTKTKRKVRAIPALSSQYQYQSC